MTIGSTPQSAEQRELDLGVLLAEHPELQIAQDLYNINVTANFGDTLTPEAVANSFAAHDGANKPAHLYFHIPLCSYICHFCNYVKHLLPSNGKRHETLDQWTELLVQESQWYLDQFPWIQQAHIESLYIGGGTAAELCPSHLERLMGHVQRHYKLTDNCEKSLEGNPDNFIHRDFVQAACDLGFNRFSVGVQSLQDEVNHFAGRGHDSAMSRKAIQILSETEHPFNVDMMFGLPHQTVETVEQDIQTLVSMKVPTITIYRLRNADREKMGIGNKARWNVPRVRDQLHREGLFPTLQETYAMRAGALRVLLAHGYRPSPCGWWSAPGTYPDGNIPRVSRNKWQRFDSMLAYGPGAYGWLSGNGSQITQTHNEKIIAAYARKMQKGGAPPLASGRHLAGHAAIACALGFAYKANQPIDIDRFQEHYKVHLLRDEPYQSVIGELVRKQLMKLSPDGAALQPTLEGEALHEEIISVYFHERIGQYQQATCHR